MWRPHIQIEEQHFDLKLVGELLPAEEHLRLLKSIAEFSQANSGPPYLTIPFILHNLASEARAVLAKSMPAEVIEQLVPVVWKEQWQSMKPFLLE